MPPRDSIHDAVVEALMKDGWAITHDPLSLQYGERHVLIDLGAEDWGDSLLSLERAEVQIAIEVKSFLGGSAVGQLEQAVGQYVVYDMLLSEVDPGRTLYLAISTVAFDDIFAEPLGELVRQRVPLRVIIVDCQNQEIVKWMPHPSQTF